MEINIINYILDKKNISQNQLAEMLDPPVTKSVISKWKNGGEAIPQIRVKQLTKIARIGMGKDGQTHNKKWLEITNKSQKNANIWYERFECHISSVTNDIYKADWGEINYDSVWIFNIQKMLITLSEAGVPVKDLLEDFTFDHTREANFHEVEGQEYPEPEYIYTPTDNLLIPYIQIYVTLRDWISWHILKINDKKIGALQFELADKAVEVALYRIPKESFKAVGTNLDVLEKYIAKSKEETFHLVGEFSNIVATGFDYLRYINADTQGLINDIKAQPKWIEGQKKKAEKQYGVSFDSASERQILDGIQNNEKLLKEILEKLNNLTNNGETK
jgi:hypothetical protein